MSPRNIFLRVGPAPCHVACEVRSGGLSRLVSLLVVFLAVMLLLPSISEAQGRKSRRGKKKQEAVATVKETKSKGGGKNQVFDFTGLNLGASMRTPQLLYFLDRASEELHRASLQRRSFVPEMVRSIQEEGL